MTIREPLEPVPASRVEGGHVVPGLAVDRQLLAGAWHGVLMQDVEYCSCLNA